MHRIILRDVGTHAVPEHNERNISMQPANVQIDCMNVVDDRLPSIVVGKVTKLVGATAVPTMIVAVHNAAARGRSRRKPSVSIRMFAETMQYLDNMCGRGGWVPYLQWYFVPVLGAQDVALVISHRHSRV